MEHIPLSGVVPGKYYLKFTYGDGSVSITDLNNNLINQVKTKSNGNAINSNYYKSTILTGAAKDATLEDDSTKAWFLNSMAKGENIATDNNGIYYHADGTNTPVANVITERTTSNKELNYTSAQDKIVINANSPIMNIQLEYLNADNLEVPRAASNPKQEENKWNETFKNNCSEMDFGIIERPNVDIKLKKEISNVKLTLSNGTTIINGDPKDQMYQNL